MKKVSKMSAWRQYLPYKSVLIGIKDVEARNAKFHSLSKGDKKKEIAIDALSLLINEKITPKKSVYWNTKLHYKADFDSKKFQENVLNVSKEKQKCEVCAKGAIMLSTIRCGNKISEDDWGYHDASNVSLLQGFSSSEMNLLENYFERWDDFEGEDYRRFTANERMLNALLLISTGGSLIRTNLLKDHVTPFLKACPAYKKQF